jgi:hypothetical protein
MKNFYNFIKNYDIEDVRTMAEHGCLGGISGMIYYTETTAIYDQHADELHDLVERITEEFGAFPAYIADNIGSQAMFKNAMVWLCAELVAQEIISELEASE